MINLEYLLFIIIKIKYDIENQTNYKNYNI